MPPLSCTFLNWKPVWSRRISASRSVLPALLLTLVPLGLLSRAPLSAQEPTATAQGANPAEAPKAREPVDYVNPDMGNISHLLVPTFPTVSLPNSLLRMIPDRESFTSTTIGGLNLLLTSHRSATAFRLRPFDAADDGAKPPERYTYDQEKTAPYRYSVYLDEQATNVAFAPAHDAAIYTFGYEHPAAAHHFALTTAQGALKVEGHAVHGYQMLGGGTKAYLFLEFSATPEKVAVLKHQELTSGADSAEGTRASVVLSFAATPSISVRYGISYLSEEQAKKTWRR